MDLKFTFGASNPLPLATEGAGSASAPGSASSTLELRVSLDTAGRATDSAAGGAAGGAGSAGGAGFAEGGGSAGGSVVCEALSGDGVSYARAEKALRDRSPAGVAAAVRSALARAGAELPEPLIESVTDVVLELGEHEAAVLAELGLAADPDSDPLAAIDTALQARTGIAAGTPIRRGAH